MKDKSLKSQHSDFGPSQIEAILRCPGRVRMCKGLKNASSKYAAEGTFAHQLAEQFLKHDPSEVEIQGLLGNKKQIDGHEIPITEEMLAAVNTYVNHCRSLKSNFSCNEAIETHTTLEHIGLPEVYGTLDYAISNVDQDTLFVRDFKYGKGLSVSPEWNAQLLCYAAGHHAYASIQGHAHNTINIGIVQPRISEEPLIWEVPYREVRNWCLKKLVPAIKQAKQYDSPCVPGDVQCRWCAAKGECAALKNDVIATISKDFVVTKVLPFFDKIPTHQAKAIIQKKKRIVDFITAVENNLRARLQTGEKIEGIQLKQGRQRKKWNVSGEALTEALKTVFSDQAGAALGNYLYETKHVSPAHALRDIESLYENFTYDAKKNSLMEFIDITHDKPSVAFVDTGNSNPKKGDL